MKIIPVGLGNIKTNPYTNNYKKDCNKATISGDRLEISLEAKELMEDSTLIRTDKVEKLKSQIENGTYKVNSLDTANKILKDIQIYNDLNTPRK